MRFNIKQAYFPLLFSIVFITGLFLGAIFINTITDSKEKSIFQLSFKKYDKLNDIIDLIEDNYVDSVTKDHLVEEAIQSLLSKLDPHSVYISANEFKEMNESLMGNFEGIGIEFRIERDTIVVLNTISGGPSEKLGVKSGDRIIKVNDTLVAGVGISNQDAIKKLKGPKNTKVKVSISRKNSKELIDFYITRDVIPSYSIDVSYMADDDIGYIKINRFSGTTYDEFLESVHKLRFAGMKKLLIDLRGNGGGYLDAAIDIADEFLGNKELIVYTEGFNKPKTIQYANKGGSLLNIPFVILIDEWSASASEVLTGALQDNDKGLVVGKRSFGKGLVQEQIELEDGSAIRLTVSRYYTPTGRSIQRSYTNESESYYMDFYKRLVEEDDFTDIPLADTLKYFTPKGRVVYGGGGITPDIIVADTQRMSLYIQELSNKSVIYEFCFEYVDENRDLLKQKFSSAKDFNKRFLIDAEIYNVFINYVKENGIKIPEEENNKDAVIIKVLLKAYMGRNLFNNESFYPTLHIIDETYKKGLEILKNNNLYDSLQNVGLKK